jgi:hypothetical protein
MIRSRVQKKTELHKLVVARSDIAQAQRTCQIILEKVTGFGDSLYPPLFHAAVVAYGRPFVDNKSTGVLSRHWSQFPDGKLAETRKKLLQTRHELVAHSDSETRAVYIIPPTEDVPGLPNDRKSVSIRISSYYYPAQQFADAFELCSDLINRLSGRIDELLTELYDSHDLPEKAFRLDFSDGL